MATKSAQRKIDRALNLNWTRALPKWLGPGRWIRLSKKERREHMANVAKMKTLPSWARFYKEEATNG